MMWTPAFRPRLAAALRTRSLRALPAYWFVQHTNVGDAIAPVILEHYLRRPIGWVQKGAAGKIISTGSLASRAADGDLILGSGLMEDRSFPLSRGAVALCVRGPLTRDRLGTDRVPEVYGDPGSLIPAVTGLTREPGDQVGLIPHFVDKTAVRGAGFPEDVVVIDVQAPWRDVVDRIRRCRAVASSSLHGVIIAEAFGIPAVWISISDSVTGAMFKFNDYYLGTGRPTRTPMSLAAGIELVRSGELAEPRIGVEPLEEAFRRARELIG